MQWWEERRSKNNRLSVKQRKMPSLTFSLYFVDRWYHLRPPNSATRHKVIHHHSNSACHCLGSEGLLGQMEREVTRLAI